jgi:hypothetical protein
MNIKTTSRKIKKVKSYLKKQKANLALKLRDTEKKENNSVGKRNGTNQLKAWLRFLGRQ